MGLFTKKPDSLGQFEQLVLTAVMSLGKDAYGMEIHEKVSEMSERNVNLGGIYVTLDRLLDKGLLTARFSEPMPDRGGRRRRHFRLEDKGIEALQESVQTAQRIAEVFEESWGIGKWKVRRRRV